MSPRTTVLPGGDSVPAETMAWHIRNWRPKNRGGDPLPAPTREHHFAEDINRHHRFDFAWPEVMVALEVDGGSWSNGRHVRGGGFEKDCEKSCLAAIRLWRVLHVTTEQVESGQAVAWLAEALQEAGKARQEEADHG